MPYGVVFFVNGSGDPGSQLSSVWMKIVLADNEQDAMRLFAEYLNEIQNVEPLTLILAKGLINVVPMRAYAYDLECLADNHREETDTKNQVPITYASKTHIVVKPEIRQCRSLRDGHPLGTYLKKYWTNSSHENFRARLLN